MPTSSNNRNWTLKPLAPSPAGSTAAGRSLDRVTSPGYYFPTQTEVSSVSPRANRNKQPWLQYWHQQQYRSLWQQSWEQEQQEEKQGEETGQPQPQHEQPQSQSLPHAVAAPTSSTPASHPSPHQHHHRQQGQRAPSIVPFASSFLSFASSLLSLPPHPLPLLEASSSSPSPPSSLTPNPEPTSANALTSRCPRRFPASNNRRYHHDWRVLERESLVSDNEEQRCISPLHRATRNEATFTLTTAHGTTQHNPFEFLQTYSAPFALSSTFVGFPQRASLFHWSVRLASPSGVFEASIISDPETARHDVAICLRQEEALPSPPPRKHIRDISTSRIPNRRLLDYDTPSPITPPQNDNALSRCMKEQDHVSRCQLITETINTVVNTTPLTPPPTPSPSQSPNRAMNDPPQLVRPMRQLTSRSPTRHRHTASVSDDFLAQLAPQSAVDALTSATGSLRACLDGASASERDFTMRTAMASNMIWSWVQELSEWTWPSEGGSAGFKSPVTSQSQPEHPGQKYMGSLRTEDVALYETRIEIIQREMMELEVEDIKSHVMSQHILPLSRPNTPMSTGSKHSMSTMSSNYNKMEDLSAAVTAIVINTLPNLAKLSRLLQTWSIRLRVLQQVPRLLLAIQDAEVALLSGWNAITTPTKLAQQHASGNSNKASLTRDHFNVMRAVVEQKVTSGGRTADYMLDCLEGESDTLPDEWLDRLEKVEQDYVDWVTVCERKMQETEWAQTQESHDQATEKTSVVASSDAMDNASNQGTSQLTRAGQEPVEKVESIVLEAVFTTSSNDTNEGAAAVVAGTVNNRRQGDASEAEGTSDTPERPDLDAARISSGFDGAACDFSASFLEPPLPIVAIAAPDAEPKSHTIDEEMVLDEESAYTNVDEVMDLPPLRSDSRRNSDASQASTVLHGASSNFEGSDMPEMSLSPDIVRTQIREAEYITTSSPISPPLSEEDEPEKKTKPTDISLIGTVPEEEEEDLPRTPLDESFMDDFDDSFSVSEAATESPSKCRGSSSDMQLHQQISEIIESIPAKIKLTNETPHINLNPPDLQLPKMRKKPSIDRFKRSGSAMSAVSSRSGTPAFTLSPAKNARPSRAQRGQQEIKVYHLSRSTGEAPIKLFIRCVGENGERVMVRVGGGWADLSEYLKEYASHHKRRSAAADGPKVEVRDVPRVASGRGTAIGSSPPSRPGSALDSPFTPLNIRKPRRSSGAFGNEAPRLVPRTPAAAAGADDSLGDIPQSEDSMRSRSSSRLGWVEDDSSFLGLAGPSGKRIEMSEENKAWVESVKQKVRMASGEMRAPPLSTGVPASDEFTNNKGRFGELGKVGGTKRLFRKSEDVRKK